MDGSQRSWPEVAESEPNLSHRGPATEPSAALMFNTWMYGEVQTFLANRDWVLRGELASIVMIWGLRNFESHGTDGAEAGPTARLPNSGRSAAPRGSVSRSTGNRTCRTADRGSNPRRR